MNAKRKLRFCNHKAHKVSRDLCTPFQEQLNDFSEAIVCCFVKRRIATIHIDSSTL